MRTRYFAILQTLILALFSLAFTASGEIRQDQERILSFHSDIEVFSHAGMTVTETIRVYASGNEIKRGIYRDFPTKYKDRYRQNYTVKFEVKEVLLNGKQENYHLKKLKNGVRVYIGNENGFLDPGKYEYVIKYSTSRQLGFFRDFDELYWNVTGNGWTFPIEKVSTIVRVI